MAKRKKTDLEVVKKAEIEPIKDRISDLQEHITKPITKHKNKRKKSKEKIDDDKKRAGGKTGVKQKPGADDKGNREQRSGKGEKTGVQGVAVKRQGFLDKILPPWF